MGHGLIERAFLDRPATEVAPDLLGCVLTHRSSDGEVSLRLTEVEAYMGSIDPASHSFRGRTARNGVMFGPPGHAYVYFIYGMHFSANIVCMPPGTAQAVLLRAGEVVAGEDLARARRPHGALASGPGRLAQAMAIDRALNGVDVCSPASPLVLSPGTAPGIVRTGPRVGVSAAAAEPWRFWIDGDPTVSAYRAHVPRRR